MKFSGSIAVFALTSSMALLAPHAHALTLLDNFTNAQTVSVTGVGTSSSEIAASNALGGYRRLFVNHQVAADPGVDTITANVRISDSTFTYSSPSDNEGFAKIQYDATPGNTLVANGGNFDLSLEKYLGGSYKADLLGYLTLRLYSDAANYTEATLSLPSTIGVPGGYNPFQINFSSMTTIGTGVDLAHVGSVELIFGGAPDFDGNLRLLQFNNVPEPGSVAFAVTGSLTTLGLLRRRRSRK